MLQLTEVVDGPTEPPSLTLLLDFEDRRRSRWRVRLSDGSEAALLLPRGTCLRDGQRLRGEAGTPIVEVRAAAETLSVASTTDPHLLARGAYHLGNRHVPLQVGEGWLAYQHDHVLDELARELGLHVEVATRPFEPEVGGYGHTHQRGSHGRHQHEHEHEHHEHNQHDQPDQHNDDP